MKDNVSIIQSQLSEPILLEMLAEECSELCKSALKKSRVIRAENYTPITYKEAQENLVEEFSDLILCAKVLNLVEDDEIINYKLNRWVKRLEGGE